LALPTLFDAVVARFELEGTDAPQTFGWRTPFRHKESTSRIAWVPGSPSGALGDVDAASKTGDRESYRSLATLRELFTVYIESEDPQFPENERAQYQATRLLFDAWVRAVYLAARGTFEIESSDWNIEKNERRNGAELIVVCSIDAVIPDAPYTVVDPPLEANIATSTDDVTESTVTTTAP